MAAIITKRVSQKMDCPKCKTYNPEDRDTCWRCDAPLPKPVETKKRDPRAKNQIMMYVLIAALLLFSLLQMCRGGAPTATQQTPTGYVPQAVPAVGIRV
jgi:hypothetical protein